MNITEAINKLKNPNISPEELSELDGIIFSDVAGLAGYVSSDYINNNGHGRTIKEIINAINLNSLSDDPEKQNTQRKYLEAIRDNPRYRDLRVSHSHAEATVVTDAEGNTYESEFKSAAIHLTNDPNGPIVMAYAGTGLFMESWIEDGRMGGTKYGIEAQIEALRQLQTVMRDNPNSNVVTTGYSKGSNLAMYASAYADYDPDKLAQGKQVKISDGDNSFSSRIIGALFFDGPGFNTELLEDPVFSSLLYEFLRRDNVSFYTPENSFVGSLLNDHNIEIVYFRTNNLDQIYNPEENLLLNFLSFLPNFVMCHLSLNWEFDENGHLITIDENGELITGPTPVSKTLNGIGDNLVTEISRQDFMQLCNLLSDIFAIIGIEYTTDFGAISIDQLPYILKELEQYLRELPDEDLDIIFQALNNLLSNESLDSLIEAYVEQVSKDSDVDIESLKAQAENLKGALKNISYILSYLGSNYSKNECLQLLDIFANILEIVGVNNTLNFSELSDGEKKYIIDQLTDYILTMDSKDLRLLLKFISEFFSDELLPKVIETVILILGPENISEIKKNFKNFSSLIKIISGLIIGGGVGAISAFALDKFNDILNDNPNLKFTLENAAKGTLLYKFKHNIVDYIKNAALNALQNVLYSFKKASKENKLSAKVYTFFATSFSEIKRDIVNTFKKNSKSSTNRSTITSQGKIYPTSSSEVISIDSQKVAQAASDLINLESKINTINRQINNVNKLLKTTLMTDNSNQNTNMTYQQKYNLADLTKLNSNIIKTSAQDIQKKILKVEKVEEKLKNFTPYQLPSV